MSESKAALSAAKVRVGALVKATPALFEGFSKISKTATANGSFSAAEKELMATAIAVVQGCEDCILYHVEGAKKHGAEETALVEALEVAVEMGGGPAVMYAAKALDAFRAL
ncbi:MAG: carboxymuconolactone decarboxylase family protein [Pseudomonadota bacterium]